jgi:hypothetical protein
MRKMRQQIGCLTIRGEWNEEININNTLMSIKVKFELFEVKAEWGLSDALQNSQIPR